MSVLLTGASGFIGLNVAEALLACGRKVVLFSGAPLPEEARAVLAALPGAIVEVQGDVRARTDLERVFREHRPNRVVHGAAMTPGPVRERQDARPTVEVNVLGTLTVLEAAARDHGITRFVQISSGAVYGCSGFPVSRLDEDSPPLPEGTYGISKLAGEQLALRLGALWGLDVVVCRVGAVFGPWERDTGVRETLSPILQVTRLALHGSTAILPRPGLRDWVYSRDVAEAIVTLLDAPAPRHQVYNIGPGLEWTVEAWCAKLAEVFPGFTHRLAGPEAAANVDLWGERDRAPLAVDRLTDDLGYRPRFGLAEAFADYLAWLGKNHAFVG